MNKWGRGATLAGMAMLLGTVVMLIVLFKFGDFPATELREVLGDFFLLLVIVGGATQAPNVVERLPGTRTWTQPPGYDQPAPPAG